MKELEYEGDKGYRGKHIDIKYLSPNMLDVFVDAYTRKHEITKEQIELDEFHYLILMFRRGGYMFDFTFGRSDKYSDKL